jgi:hypothetical protein
LDSTQLIIIGVIVFVLIDTIFLLLFFKFRSKQAQANGTAPNRLSEEELAALPTYGPVLVQNSDLDQMLRDLVEKQENARRFFRPYGDGFVFDFSSVSDQQQREQIYRSLHQINRTGTLPKSEMLKLIFSLLKAT